MARTIFSILGLFILMMGIIYLAREQSGVILPPIPTASIRQK